MPAWPVMRLDPADLLADVAEAETTVCVASSRSFSVSLGALDRSPPDVNGETENDKAHAGQT